MTQVIPLVTESGFSATAAQVMLNPLNKSFATSKLIPVVWLPLQR